MNTPLLQTPPPFAAAEYIREIGRGAKGARSLSKERTHQVFSAMLENRISDLELGALLLAWRIKGESVEELAGMLDAAHVNCHPLSAINTGSALPVVIPSYNGARKQPNLVPLLAILLARQGVPVLVHGVSTFSSRVTTAMLFEALGMTCCVSMQEAEARLMSDQPAFVPIQVLSPAIASLLDRRNSIGLRNSAHTIVKMLQPVGSHSEHEAVRLVNYTHPEYLETLTVFFKTYPANVLLARGTEGEAVADARRATNIVWVKDGQQKTVVEAETGSVETLADLPSGLDVKATADYIKSVLSGQNAVPGPIAEQVRIITEIAHIRPGAI